MNYLNRYIPKMDILWPHRSYQDAGGNWVVFHELLEHPVTCSTHKTQQDAREHAAKLNEYDWAKNSNSCRASARARRNQRRKWGLMSLLRGLKS